MNKGYASDSEIIDLLFKRDERSLELLSDKYRNLYMSIIREMLSNESDVEECANDLLLGVWYSIPPNRPDSLTAYMAKLARRIGINRFRYNTRQKRGEGYTVLLSELEENIGELPDAPESADNTELVRVLSDFVRGLDEETRVLFVRRYVYLESVPSLAERFGITENYVSVKLHRTRKKLMKSLKKGGMEI